MESPDSDKEPKPDENAIPKELFSDYEERPFHTCTRCGETLADFLEGYQVAKVIKRGETIFEYAICSHCHSGMIEEFSEETREALEVFYAENMTTGLGLCTCGVCGIDREDDSVQEFTIAAICQSLSTVDTLMLCSDCTDRTNDLISQQTRDVWRRFVDENFPGVPSDAQPSPTRVPVF